MKVQETINSQDYMNLCISAVDMIDIRVLNKVLDNFFIREYFSQTTIICFSEVFLFIRNNA